MIVKASRGDLVVSNVCRGVFELGQGLSEQASLWFGRRRLLGLFQVDLKLSSTFRSFLTLGVSNSAIPSEYFADACDVVPPVRVGRRGVLLLVFVA